MFTYYYDCKNNDYSIIELYCDFEKGCFRSIVFTRVRDKVKAIIYKGDFSQESNENFDLNEILINSALQSCVAFANNQLFEEYKNCDENFFAGEIHNYLIEKIIDKIPVFYNDGEMKRMLLRHSFNQELKNRVEYLLNFLSGSIIEERI